GDPALRRHSGNEDLSLGTPAPVLAVQSTLEPCAILSCNRPTCRGIRPVFFWNRTCRMASIYPFRAWRYNPATVRLDDVVTQPYDKISPAMQQAYYQRSPYNLVRIILGLP